MGTRRSWRDCHQALHHWGKRDRTDAASRGEAQWLSRRSPRLGPMRRANVMHFDGWTSWTWDGRGTPFNGGALDNVLYSSRTLAPRHAWIWDTEQLPADTLRANELDAGASAAIGRHRPVVVDFELRTRIRAGTK